MAAPESPHRLGARIRSAGVSIEWVIVILTVTAAVLTAVAFWQATRFGDDSAERINQARFTEALRAQQRSALEAKIAHDRRIHVSCLDADVQRTAELRQFSQSFEAAALEAFVRAELTRVVLANLWAGHSGVCDRYDIDWAIELDQLNTSREPLRHSGDPGGLRDEARSLNDAEFRAVAAAVAFAVALLLVTAADAAERRRWKVRWLGAAGFGIASGIVVTAIAYFSAKRQPDWLLWAVLLVLTAVLVGIGLGLAWAERAGLLRRATSWLDGSPGLRRRISLARPVRWWAELFGALAVVVFAVAVLGLSNAGAKQRDALARGDELTAQARHALELGAQSSLAALGFVSQLAEIDAYGAATAGTERAWIADHRRVAVLNHWQQREVGHWPSLLDLAEDERGAAEAQRSGDQPGCLEPELVLPWQRSGRSDGADAFPEALLVGLREDRSTLQILLEESSAGAVRCYVEAAVRGEEAQAWGRQASLFTVALVVLGVAGFLFAQSADVDRSPLPRRWLFASGIVALLLGAGTAGMARATSPPGMGDDQLARATRAYAESDVSSRLGRCEPDASLLSLAKNLEELRAFAPAHLVYANVVACDEDADWLLSPDIPRLGEFRKALEEARDLEWPSSTLDGQLGWAYALEAVRGERSLQRAVDLTDLQRAVDLTDDALSTDRSNPFWCFNRAFLALAGRDAQASSRYGEALASLRGEKSEEGNCEPVDFTHPLIRNYLRLLALADLELLPEHPNLDRYRELIVADTDVAPADSLDTAPFELFFYPQEVELRATPDWEARPFSAVWYYRPDDDAAWSVMILPSMSTLRPDTYLDERSREPWRLDRIVPDGQYRVDIYVDGALVGRVEQENGWWRERDLDWRDFKWVQSPQVGVSAVIPREWDVLDEIPGVEIAFGSDSGMLVWRRAEGADRWGMSEVLRESATRWFEERGLDPLAADALPDPHDGYSVCEPETWYLYMCDTIAVEAGKDVFLGVGRHQYLRADGPAQADASGVPILDQFDVEHDSCPGTHLMTIVQATDPGVLDTVWWSQVRLGGTFEVGIDEIALGEEEQWPSTLPFFVQVPDGWTRAVCPYYLVAAEPAGGAYVWVYSEPWDKPLDDYVESKIALYDSLDPQEYGEFSSESSLGELPDGLPAITVEGTWTFPEDEEGGALRWTQVYAVREDRAYRVTVWMPDPRDDAFREEVIRSFRLAAD